MRSDLEIAQEAIEAERRIATALGFRDVNALKARLRDEELLQEYSHLLRRAAGQEELFVLHARELCAAFADMDGNWKPAENYRAGLMDDSEKVQQAVRAFRAASEQVSA